MFSVGVGTSLVAVVYQMAHSGLGGASRGSAMALGAVGAR